MSLNKGGRQTAPVKKMQGSFVTKPKGTGFKPMQTRQDVPITKIHRKSPEDVPVPD